MDTVVHDVNRLAGLKVLVIEDEAMVAMMIEDLVTGFGCRARLAPGIEQALAAIGEDMPDGVLLDMNVHGERTTALAEELSRRSIPFLLVTGYEPGESDPAVIKAAQRLQKPFREGDLRRRMGEAFLGTTGLQ